MNHRKTMNLWISTDSPGSTKPCVQKKSTWCVLLNQHLSPKAHPKQKTLLFVKGKRRSAEPLTFSWWTVFAANSNSMKSPIQTNMLEVYWTINTTKFRQQTTWYTCRIYWRRADRYFGWVPAHHASASFMFTRSRFQFCSPGQMPYGWRSTPIKTLEALEQIWTSGWPSQNEQNYQTLQADFRAVSEEIEVIQTFHLFLSGEKG